MKEISAVIRIEKFLDLENERMDVDGKPGKIKAMGVDLKRSDTPDFVQKFLEKLLTLVLLGTPKDQCFQTINEFKEEFSFRDGWEKGTPKRVNNLTKYRNQVDLYNSRTQSMTSVKDWDGRSDNQCAMKHGRI